MARIVCDEIKFESLSKELQKALNLLLKQKEKASRYWKKIRKTGGRGSYLEAYGLSLSFRVWRQFKTGIKGYPYEGPDIPPDLDAIEKMTKLGWTPKAYDAFMEWFEADDLPKHYMGKTNILSLAERNRRHNFLKNFLSN